MSQEPLPAPQLITDPPDQIDHLAAVRALAKALDSAVTVPGTKIRFGADAIVGLIPGIGDAATAAAGGYIVFAAAKLGVGTAVLARMMLHLLIDAVVGAVPFFGDLFDVGYRVHARNAALLERAVADPTRTRRSSTAVLIVLGVVLLLILAGGIVLSVLLARWVWGLFG